MADPQTVAHRPKKAHVKLLYDISSPWSYVAFTILTRYKEVWNFDLELRPIFLGGIMVFTGNEAPALRPEEEKYNTADSKRVWPRFGLDIRSPPGHPMKTTSLNIIRFLRALLEEEGQETLAKCTRLIFLEFYSVHTDYTTDKFWECLVPTISKEKLQHLRKVSQSARHKDGVKEDIRQAVEQHGMFGAPFLVGRRAHDGKIDSFFGIDRFEALAWWLGDGRVWRGPYPDGTNPASIISRRAPAEQSRL